MPGLAIKVAGMVALSSTAEKKLVESFVVPQKAFALEVKFVPLMIRENPALPAVTEVVLRLVMVGFCGLPGLIVNVFPFDVPPAVSTVTVTVPDLAIRPAGTVAVISDAFTNLVVSLALPQSTVAPET